MAVTAELRWIEAPSLRHSDTRNLMSAPYPTAIRPCRPSPWPIHSSRSAKVLARSRSAASEPSTILLIARRYSLYRQRVYTPTASVSRLEDGHLFARACKLASGHQASSARANDQELGVGEGHRSQNRFLGRAAP